MYLRWWSAAWPFSVHCWCPSREDHCKFARAPFTTCPIGTLCCTTQRQITQQRSTAPKKLFIHCKFVCMFGNMSYCPVQEQALVSQNVCDRSLFRYTIVMVYYAFGLVAMMLVRPILSAKFVHNRGTKSIYAALYFFPILVVIQAVFAGLLCKLFVRCIVFSKFSHCPDQKWHAKRMGIISPWSLFLFPRKHCVADYSFPYIILVVSIITSATHFAYFEIQVTLYFVKWSISTPNIKLHGNDL